MASDTATLYFVSNTGVASVKYAPGKEAAAVRALQTHGFRQVTRAEYQKKQRQIRRADNGK